MAKAGPIGIWVSILAQLRCMFSMAFNRLGLFKSAEEAIYSGELHPLATTTSNEDSDYVLMWDGPSPSPVPVPIPIATAFIKKRLPVVLFSDFTVENDDFDGCCSEPEVDTDRRKMRCSVCWDCMEGSSQIRELSNCCHVFHRECLDRWVDEGQLTCPLCRSTLLPPDTSPWVLLRNASNLFDTPTEQHQMQSTTGTT